MAAVWPFFIGQVCDVQSEPLFMACFLAAILLAIRGARSGSVFQLFAAGLSGGAAALARPVGLILPVLLAAVPGRVRGRRARIRIVLAIALGTLCSIGPWTVRNALRYGQPILINDAGGYNFWRGTSPEMAAIGKIRDPRAFGSASIRFEKVVSPGYARRIDAAGSTPLSRDRQWRRLAMENFMKDPGGFIRQLGRNAGAYWRPWLNPQSHGMRLAIASGFMMTCLYALAIAGYIELWNVNRPLALWCGMSALAFWLVQVPFQVTNRFRAPIADPFLIVFAASFLSRWTAMLFRGERFDFLRE